jgi:hypothetical protein
MITLSRVDHDADDSDGGAGGKPVTSRLAMHRALQERLAGRRWSAVPRATIAVRHSRRGRVRRRVPPPTPLAPGHGTLFESLILLISSPQLSLPFACCS